ncbi:MAG: hypothetical protein ACI9C4_001841 [Paraglaciecola sp.]|jgi:hypothetical protein
MAPFYLVGCINDIETGLSKNSDSSVSFDALVLLAALSHRYQQPTLGEPGALTPLH